MGVGDWLTNNPVTQFTKQLDVPGTISDLASNVGAGIADLKTAGRGLASLDPSANKPIGDDKKNVDPKAATPPAGTTTSPAGAGAGPQVAQPTTPAMNPLAVNLYYAQSIAPMMQKLQAQNEASNKQFYDIANNNPMAQYMPPQFKALFQEQNASQAALQNNAEYAQMQAAPAGAALDQIMAQLNAARQASVTDYEKNLYLAAQNLASGNPLAPSGTQSSQAQVNASAQQLIDQAAQNTPGAKPSGSTTGG